jgi:hypothetical protein
MGDVVVEVEWSVAAWGLEFLEFLLNVPLCLLCMGNLG